MNHVKENRSMEENRKSKVVVIPAEPDKSFTTEDKD